MTKFKDRSYHNEALCAGGHFQPDFGAVIYSCKNMNDPFRLRLTDRACAEGEDKETFLRTFRSIAAEIAASNHAEYFLAFGATEALFSVFAIAKTKRGPWLMLSGLYGQHSDLEQKGM